MEQKSVVIENGLDLENLKMSKLLYAHFAIW